MDSQATLAKLTAPRLGKIYPCERLHTSLAHACESPMVWITGAPGAGKTTLVAGWIEARKLRALWYQLDASDSDPATFFHYLNSADGNLTPRKRSALPQLTPEHLPSLGAFARRYFERLGTALPYSTVLVLDNYHEIALDSPLHALLAEALPLLPPHVNVVILSRTEPPAAFARLRINRHIALIGAEEFKLSVEEAVGLAQCSGHTQSREFVIRLHTKAAGWMAGLVLLLECARNRSEHVLSADVAEFPTTDQQLLFDYFASEILAHNPPEVQNVLFKTAFLSRITVSAARLLTGVTQAGDILNELARRCYFTVRHPGPTEDAYEYHPLFRTFLINQVRIQYSDEEFDNVRHLAAASLVSQGDIESAARLYLDLRAWDKALELCLTHAPQLLTQGRHGALRQWIAALPVERAGANPELKLLLATATQPTDLVVARQYFAEAFEAFKECNDASGTYSAWGGAVETFIYRWSDFTALSHWIEELNAVRIRHPQYPSATVEARVVGGMVNALMWRCPRHEIMRPWVERAEELLLDTNIALAQRLAIANNLIFYRTWWLGDLASAVHILSIIKPLLRGVSAEPLPMLLWHVMESAYLAGINAHEECLRTIANGLRLAENSGIHFLNAMLNGKGVYASLFAGDIRGAEDYLQRTHSDLTPDAYLDISHHHHQATWIALCRGDFDEARAQLNVCVRFAEKSGTPVTGVWIKHTLPHVLVESGAYSEALQYLDDALQFIDVMQGGALKFHCLLSRAYVLLRAGDCPGAVDTLTQALTFGKQQGYVSPPWIGWRRDVMAQLCALALTHRIESEYVVNIIRQRGLLPPENFEVPDTWPFQIKLYTLGRFAVTTNNSPIKTSGNAARKPLALLKALIAFGGRDVNQQKLIQALWPDAEGDAGRKAFEIALHRLRKLFGSDAPLILKNGELSLNARLCWVDCWALERLLSKLDTSVNTADVDTQLDPVFDLYQGPFLGHDEDLPCVLPLQEKLRSRVLRNSLRIAECCENQDHADRAEQIYLHLLETEPLLEEVYRHLIRLYQWQDRHADALNCYCRCERMLDKLLGIAPSFTLSSVTSSRPSAPQANHKRPH